LPARRIRRRPCRTKPCSFMTTAARCPPSPGKPASHFGRAFAAHRSTLARSFVTAWSIRRLAREPCCAMTRQQATSAGAWP
jgi:hypothetical protein